MKDETSEVDGQATEAADASAADDTAEQPQEPGGQAPQEQRPEPTRQPAENAEQGDVQQFHAVKASIIDADVIHASRVVVSRGGNKASIAANDHGVWFCLSGDDNDSNVNICLTDRHGAIVSLHSDRITRGFDLALILGDSKDATPKLQVTSARGNGKVVQISLMELAENLQATMRDTEEVNPAKAS